VSVPERLPLPDRWAWVKDEGHPWAAERDGQYHVWMTDGTMNSTTDGMPREVVQAVVVSDLTNVEAMDLLRRLASLYPEHVVVAAEEVQARTRPSVAAAWRHPDDVELRADVERAWVAATYWRDSIACESLLTDAIPYERRIALLDGARHDEETETGMPALLGGAR
jgi:hypothetical protein